MARFTFRLPDIGEGIASAEIVAWHVAVGQRVEEDAPLADMMTDKATVEMESPVSGVVVELAGQPGDSVAIGATLAVIEVDGDTAAEPTRAEQPVATEAAPVAAPAPAPARAPAPAPAPTEPIAAPVPTTPEAKTLASPAVRARAKALAVDLTQIKAEGGHVRHADLDAFLRYGSAQGYRPAAATRADEAVPVIGLRRRIAENMAAAKRTIPHFTYVEEIEVTRLEAMRAELNAARGARPKLTLLPFLITAICRALPQFPMLNARYDDEAGVVTRHGAVHMGIATQTPGGLMVPVIRDAQGLNLWQLATEIARLSEAARNGTAKREELSGSTLTITSLGPLGGVATTPVINRPEVAIIGPNRIIERPIFVDDNSDRIRRALLMNLSISCDHRVVDGWDAASYVQTLKQLIEAPSLLLAY
jgi:2-oxoisovalerate dehydrogenase E2 component (dihydrolipoyl transacylase)